jgi:thiol-disulfide isomerase/thioredoxin
MAKLTLLKIGAGWCGPCQALAKRGALEKFASEHPDVKLEIHDDSEAGGNARWEAFADKWAVKSLPTLIWVSQGEELLRSSDTSMAAIKSQYEKALKKVEKLS